MDTKRPNSLSLLPAGTFPGAPVDATYSEEGWLLIADEGWTLHEWTLLTKMQRRQITGDVPLIDDTAQDELLRRYRMRAKERRQLNRLGLDGAA